MPTLVVVGSQWGDEGKGKIVHFLGQQADWIVRYQGGNNAGHTVVFDGQRFVLHLLPAGILLKGKRCVIANGVVVDPEALYEEVKLLERQRIRVRKRLFVSTMAHLILPYHRELDRLREETRHREALGTTRRGIGPAYADKAARIGIRVADYLDSATFETLLDRNLQEKHPLLARVGSPARLRQQIMEGYPRLRRFLQPFAVDTSLLLNRAIQQGQRVLFESAQGTLLDVDFGTYPYVTSSNPVAGGACVGTGVGPTKIDAVLGVVKAYTTRVGEGPFPTELNNQQGAILRTRGQEIGATTGRPRRCGWFDSVVVRHAVRVNGMDRLALTKLDVLEGIAPLRMCVAYRYRGRLLRDFPQSRTVQAACRPVYETLPGFHERIQGLTHPKQLPSNALRYLRRLEQLVGAKVSLLSLGQSREETIIMDRHFPWLSGVRVGAEGKDESSIGS
ncbi:MAG: adenylosuccinate synthase [Elusimicrobia bacterium]|nr:adenylosuccinate synthase [Elusimicrobiota bacterium]